MTGTSINIYQPSLPLLSDFVSFFPFLLGKTRSNCVAQSDPRSVLHQFPRCKFLACALVPTEIYEHTGFSDCGFLVWSLVLGCGETATSSLPFKQMLNVYTLLAVS